MDAASYSVVLEGMDELHREHEEARHLLRESRSLLLYNLDRAKMSREWDAIDNLQERIEDFLDGRGEVARARAQHKAVVAVRAEAEKLAKWLDEAFVADPTGRPSLLNVRVFLDRVRLLPAGDE